VRQRRNPAERGDAERFMRELLMHTPRAGEAQELGRRWLVEKARLRELFWRPWLLKRSRVLGREHWDAARAHGRGCVIAFGHLVATWAVPAILGTRGFKHYVVMSPHYWQPMPPGYEGLALLHRRREYAEKPLGNSRVLSVEGRPSRLLELLEAGESVGLTFDTPGFAATPFLGRVVALTGGPATLAFKAGAKVLPVAPERHGTRLDLRLYPPLDPADHDNPRSLRAAIAHSFEPIVLARPEAVELAWYPSPLVRELEPALLTGDER
jgi:lauroyl/myristoyl acyltransferase